MKKEEILKKSRSENQDEYNEYINQAGYKMGTVGFYIICSFVIVFNFIIGDDVYIPLALLFAYISTEALGKYAYFQKSSYVVKAITAGILTGLCIILFVAAFLKGAA